MENATTQIASRDIDHHWESRNLYGVGRVREVTNEALKAVERTNELLGEVERLREEWERSREIIESAKQMRIAADGYISTLEEANKALAECVNGALEEMERLQKVNKEIARAAEVMAQISKTLE